MLFLYTPSRFSAGKPIAMIFCAISGLLLRATLHEGLPYTCTTGTFDETKFNQLISYAQRSLPFVSHHSNENPTVVRYHPNSNSQNSNSVLITLQWRPVLTQQGPAISTTVCITLDNLATLMDKFLPVFTKHYLSTCILTCQKPCSKKKLSCQGNKYEFSHCEPLTLQSSYYMELPDQTHHLSQYCEWWK